MWKGQWRHSMYWYSSQQDWRSDLILISFGRSTFSHLVLFPQASRPHSVQLSLNSDILLPTHLLSLCSTPAKRKQKRENPAGVFSWGKNRMRNLCFFIVLILGLLLHGVHGEDPYRFFTWKITYGDIYPLGVKQRVLSSLFFSRSEVFFSLSMAYFDRMNVRCGTGDPDKWAVSGASDRFCYQR